QVAGAGEPLRDQMRMMLTENLAELAQRLRFPIVGPHTPDQLAVRPVDDCHDARRPAADDDVVGMEALIASVEPPIRTKVRGGVQVEVIAAAPSVAPPRKSMDRIPRLVVEAEFVDVIACEPLPLQLAVPTDLDQA